MLPASSSATVVFDGAEVLAARDFAVVYRLADGRTVTVAPLHIQKDTTAHFKGERGRLVLPEWYAAAWPDRRPSAQVEAARDRSPSALDFSN